MKNPCTLSRGRISGVQVRQAKRPPGEPTRNFIAAIVTQPAIGSDEEGSNSLARKGVAH